MGLFQRDETVTSSHAPLYTLSQQSTLLIVGLGNIGKEYEETRHNIGFVAIEHFATKQEFPSWISKKDLHCTFTTRTLGDSRVVLIKPTTLMNNSGEAVQAVQRFYKVNNAQTLLVYDELDIDFGLIRTREGGSAAGHNGIKSVIQHCGEDTKRMRIGIGPKDPPQIDSADYVLAKFSKEQQEHLEALKRETNSILTEFVFSTGKLPAETRTFIV
jgi:PTH1 family peptidyl-tRNA hydrolase